MELRAAGKFRCVHCLYGELSYSEGLLAGATGLEPATLRSTI